MRRLIGVGVGPGDPELITVKAIRVLRAADHVFVPVLARPGEEDSAEQGRAEATVRAHADAARIRRVAFALNEPGGVTAGRAATWDAAAAAVAGAFAAGARTVAFATIGDPAIYSTFSYLAQTVTGLAADVTIETVPGITCSRSRRAPTRWPRRWPGTTRSLATSWGPRPVPASRRCSGCLPGPDGCTTRCSGRGSGCRARTSGPLVSWPAAGRCPTCPR